MHEMQAAQHVRMSLLGSQAGLNLLSSLYCLGMERPYASDVSGPSPGFLNCLFSSLQELSFRIF